MNLISLWQLAVGFTQWWQTISWGDAATWVSGVATALAVVLGVFTLRNERRRDWTLQWRLADERERAREKEKRAQASRVTAWFDRPTNSFKILNNSGGVIYDVLLSLAKGRSESDGSYLPQQFHRMLRVVPPGELTVPCQVGWAGMSFLPSTDATFRDANGVTWFRSNYGRLIERDTDVFTFYGLRHPYTYYEQYENAADN